MRRRGFLTSSLALPLLTRPARAAPGGGNAPVVLELFTSQGCSSCPPADALLGELVRRPGVIGLAWHVDYWNNLGWKDPFARREWTERQRAYASRLQGEVYTPALVVNGAALVVGSDRAAVMGAIGAAAPLPLEVAMRHTPEGVAARLGAWPNPLTAVFAMYDPEHMTPVGAGENSGRHLTEYRVVREAVTPPVVAGQIRLPSVPKGLGAVLLIQDSSWRVIGSADLPPNTASASKGS